MTGSCFSLLDNRDDDYLDAMAQVLGKLHEPWWSMTWEQRGRLDKGETGEQGHTVATMEPKTIIDESGEEIGITSTVHSSTA